jgi:hypothetical protein
MRIHSLSISKAALSSLKHRCIANRRSLLYPLKSSIKDVSLDLSLDHFVILILTRTSYSSLSRSITKSKRAQAPTSLVLHTSPEAPLHCLSTRTSLLVVVFGPRVLPIQGSCRDGHAEFVMECLVSRTRFPGNVPRSAEFIHPTKRDRGQPNRATIPDSRINFVRTVNSNGLEGVYCGVSNDGKTFGAANISTRLTVTKHGTLFSFKLR